VGRVKDILEGILGKSERAIDELPTQDNQKNSFPISKGQLIMRVDTQSSFISYLCEIDPQKKE